MSFHALWLTRRGNTPAQFEDAFAGDAAAGRFAIADGASESCFAGLWANLLAEGFVRHANCEPNELLAHLGASQEQWQEDLVGRLVPWYSEEGARRGAFSTFLGLVVDGESAGQPCRWRAAAVGDSCLFHVRETELCFAFPLDSSKQFDKFPELLGSRTPQESIEGKTIPVACGDGLPGDRLLMMTDALAESCLVEHESGENPWSQIASLLGSPARERDFESWIESRRDSGRLQNDDVAMLVVDL